MPTTHMRRSFLVVPTLFMTLFLCSTSVFADENSDRYVTVDRVNLRSEPSVDAEVLITVNTGSSIIVENIENDWYKVVYNEMKGYMKSEFVGKQDDGEQPKPAPIIEQPEANVLTDEVASKYVTIDRVNLRSEPSLDSAVLTTVTSGSDIIVENIENDWYKVVYNGTKGYMKSEFVGNPDDLVQPTTAPIIEQPTVNVSAEEKSDKYVTIDRVNLRSEPSLDAEILITVNVGSSIIVENAEDGWHRVVYNETKGYIKSEFVGTADELKPSGSVELLEWAEAKRIFTIGTPAEIYDVRSGLKYYVKSFSNGNHADVEPITTDDTAIMLKAFSGKWSWDVRPILVTINGRTMAASVSGMPHGGGINNTNGVDGQFCIHFKGSTTHNGNKAHEKDHQAAVIEAYNKSK